MPNKDTERMVEVLHYVIQFKDKFGSQPHSRTGKSNQARLYIQFNTTTVTA